MVRAPATALHEKGKPAVTRGRKARGLGDETAQLPNGGRSMSSRFVSRFLALSVPLALCAVPFSSSTAVAAETSPYRAFSSDSYWNTPLPTDAPRDPKSNDYINYLKADSDSDYLRIAGTESHGG